MNAKRIRYVVVWIIGGGLAGTIIGFHIAGDVGAMLGEIGGMAIGLAVSTWNKIPR